MKASAIFVSPAMMRNLLMKKGKRSKLVESSNQVIFHCNSKLKTGIDFKRGYINITYIKCKYVLNDVGSV